MVSELFRQTGKMIPPMFSCHVHSTGIIFVIAECLMSGSEVAQDPTASLLLAVVRALASCQHRTATSCQGTL